MTWMCATYLGGGGAGQRMASFYFPFVEGVIEDVSPRIDAAFKVQDNKAWIRSRANALLDKNLEEIIKAVKAAKPRSKRQRKITAAEHRLEDVYETLITLPPDIEYSLKAIEMALEEARTAAADFAELRAEIIRQARYVQEQARVYKQKRNNDAVIALLLS